MREWIHYLALNIWWWEMSERMWTDVMLSLIARQYGGRDVVGRYINRRGVNGRRKKNRERGRGNVWEINRNAVTAETGMSTIKSVNYNFHGLSRSFPMPHFISCHSFFYFFVNYFTRLRGVKSLHHFIPYLAWISSSTFLLFTLCYFLVQKTTIKCCYTSLATVHFNSLL